MAPCNFEIMKLPFSPQAVVFDMDGLMFDTEKLCLEKWLEVSAEYKVESSGDFFKRFIGRRSSDSVSLLTETYGTDFPGELFLQKVSELMKEHVALLGAPHKPGLIELLDWLESRHVPKAVATSTRLDGAKKSLRDLLPRFQAVVTGEQVIHGKPAPDIFLAAADRLGVPAERCLALEDSEHGVRSAAAAGMTVIMVPDLIEPTGEIRTLVQGVCGSLHEVLELLKGF